jgi:hypothetical protein
MYCKLLYKIRIIFCDKVQQYQDLDLLGEPVDKMNRSLMSWWMYIMTMRNVRLI